MIVDALRSHHALTSVAYSDSGERVWLRWYPTVPEAKPLGLWTWSGDPVWESGGHEWTEGPGIDLPPNEWRRKRYPAPPGQHYHGQPEWFETGLPYAERAVTIPTASCGRPTVWGDGGIEVGGDGGMDGGSILLGTGGIEVGGDGLMSRGESPIVSLIVSKTTLAIGDPTVDDLPLGDGTCYRLTESAASDITGLDDGANGRLVVLENVGSHLVRIMHQDGASAAENRVITIDLVAIRLYPGMAAWLQYDGTSERWREIATVPFVSEKGDLLTHSGTRPARIAVSGNDGYVLTEDSAQDVGIKWAPPFVLKPLYCYFPALISSESYGRWVVAGHFSGALHGDQIFHPNQMYAVPIPVPCKRVLDTAALKLVIVPPMTGANVRVGIYDSSPLGAYPGTLLRDLGTVFQGFPGPGDQELDVDPPLELAADAVYWAVILSDVQWEGPATCSIALAQQTGFALVQFGSAGDLNEAYGWLADQDFDDGLPASWPDPDDVGGGVPLILDTDVSAPAVWLHFQPE